MLLETILKKIKAPEITKLSAKKPDEDFIPYVCHYDPSTILTKNGELLQTIRITGFSGESIAEELISLRDTLRDSIFDHVKENKFAFWFHTIRRRKNIVPKGEYPDFFSNKIHEDWVKKNKWDDQFVNELYVTIIIEGLDTSIANSKAFSRSFSYGATHNLHRKYLAESYKKLSAVSLKILADIEGYGGKLLTISEFDGVLHSEPMRFFGKIINLYEDRFPLSANDISTDLASHKIAFGARELEVVGKYNKNFAAMLSIKEYHEVETQLLDKILQLPFEFIITQSFDFSFDKKDLEDYVYQDRILKISGDEDLRQVSGLASLMEGNANSETDFGKLQTTIMIINRNQKALDEDITSLIEKFSSLGFVLVREDVFSEHCFWGQLPGNFSFLRRQKVINTLRIGGFAALRNFPSGSMAGNHWGSAVTTLKTVLDTPYFFNFHDKDLGHSLILGPQGSGKTTLINFLLTEARKFNNKIFYFDFNQASRPFIKALSGSYHCATKEINNAEFLQMNPFSLPKTAENSAFLSEWIKQLMVFLKGEIAEEEMNLIPQVVEQVFATESPSFIAAFDAFKNSSTNNIYEKLKIWGNGKLAYIFGSQAEIDWTNSIQAFDLTEVSAQKPVLIPIVTYLLQRIENCLDGSAATIVLDDAWELLSNTVIAPQLDEFLKRMRQKNCNVIFVAKSHDEIADSAINKIIKDNITLEIFLPNKSPQEYYKTAFELSEEEFEMVKMMENSDHQFLLKYRSDSIIIALDLEELDVLKVLAADSMTNAATEEVIAAAAAKNAENKIIVKEWIPDLVEVLVEVEADKKSEKIRLEKEASAALKLKKEQLEKDS